MRALAAVVLLPLVLAIAGCGDDEPDDPTAPVRTEVGETVTWNDFVISSGWELEEQETVIAMEESTQPVITGEVTNDGEEGRFALFRFTFVRDGERLASLNCTADGGAELAPGDSVAFTCPGFGQTFPEDYDSVQVGPVSRD